MSGLEIPERACSLFYTPHDRFTVRLVAPIIVAAELRRQADDLHELRRTIRDEDERGIRSSGMAEGISWLRKRADELDPDGMAW